VSSNPVHGEVYLIQYSCAQQYVERISIFDQSFDTLASEMGKNGQLFPLTDNTDGAAVDQVQQQYLLSLSYIDLHWINICLQVIISIFC
jgi:hypothetical protein